MIVQFITHHSWRLGVLALVLAGCVGVKATPINTAPATETSIQLSWVYDYSFAPFYAAVQREHFAAQNLKVQLQAGGFKNGEFIEPIDQVVDGKADFGMANAYSLILARAEGKPVVAVAALYQRSPAAVISLAVGQIDQPQDLVGKQVAVTAGGTTWSFLALLNSQGIAPAQVKTRPRTSFGIEPLLNGEVDAITGWLTNEGLEVKEAGYEPGFILLSDYGVDTYPAVIFTTDQVIADKPEVMERFLRAVVAGMTDVIADPDQMVELSLRHDPNLDLAGQRQRLQASLPLLNPAGSKPGLMQPEIWQASARVLRHEGVLDKPLDLKTVYTLTFLEKIYGP